MSDHRTRNGPSSTRLSQAVEHLARAPGKRLRPRLLTACAQATGGDTAAEKAACAAEAIELIHTYSLVHDDLPAMDDDALRRGIPTLHVAYDEATAILVGDGLQTRAFEIIAEDPCLDAKQRLALVSCLAKAAGFAGMVGGQSLDMEATGKTLTLAELKNIHALKTGALITAAMTMGGIVANATAEQLHTLGAIGARIGLAFQIIDDVLDVRSDSASLGKTSGKDQATEKSTYVSLMGLEKAEQAAQTLYREALDMIQGWDSAADELRSLLDQLVNRSR
ncbi:MAG: polyprenyl synthetase family protein [Congregibacter sp.]